MNTKTVVIADDVTGANDIGVMYSKSGIETYVYSFDETNNTYTDCTTLIIDTDSRFCTHDEAYRRVKNAILSAPKFSDGVKQYIDKQCSVFRGNIGAEFDAMLDTLGEEFAVVVLGFPNNGRTTINGIHYVHGVKLEDSQFRNDPVHPMTVSSLNEILSSQSRRNVTNIFYTEYDNGANYIRKKLDEIKSEGKYSYVIMDVRDNSDLEMLADVLENEKIICGSSALSEYLAKKQDKTDDIERRAPEDKRILILAGSLTPQTINQTEYIRSQGMDVIEADTTKLFCKGGRDALLKEIIERAETFYSHGSMQVMIHTSQVKEKVVKTKRLGAECGISNTDISSMVSSVIADATKIISDEMGINNIIVCGGDTSASVCAKLGIRGMKVLDEIQAGLPTCESGKYRMVLKSGSFGSDDFIIKAMKAVRME